LSGGTICAAAIAIGFSVTTKHGALVLHAMVAPIAFAGMSWLYFKHFAYTRSLTTALLFLALVFVLDVFVVALLMEKGFAMFASALGTWASFILIVVSTWGIGTLGERPKQAG
jgi:hypothetical protein